MLIPSFVNKFDGISRGKVEKILKSSLDSIPSPSPAVKNSNYGRESLLEV
jgi:hypothetical protein